MITMLSVIPAAIFVIRAAVMADTTVTLSRVNGNGGKRLVDRTAGSGLFNEESGAATARWGSCLGAADARPGTIFGKRVIHRHGQGDTGHEDRKNPGRYGKTFEYHHQLSFRSFAGPTRPVRKMLTSLETRFDLTVVRC
ncbi:hypothetical protein AC630_25970 [Bradyrhizobium sp. AS23.2]|nr:hypothetical protein AC630_25970 [Bradyrhizobium sp. AS23.2]